MCHGITKRQADDIVLVGGGKTEKMPWREPIYEHPAEGGGVRTVGGVRGENGGTFFEKNSPLLGAEVSSGSFKFYGLIHADAG